MRADGEKFVHKIRAEVQALRRLDGCEAGSTHCGKVHRYRTEIAEAAIHFRELAFFQDIAFGSVERDAVFFVGILQRCCRTLRHFFNREFAAGNGGNQFVVRIFGRKLYNLARSRKLLAAARFRARRRRAPNDP